MVLEAYINGKSTEDIVKDSLRAIGCYVDERERYIKDWISNNNLSNYPFCFHSQKGIKKDWSQFEVDKRPDFSSYDTFIEVKSISPTTENQKQSNKHLIGEIVYEYKQYADYLMFRKHKRLKESVYYVLIGPCNKNLIMDYLEGQEYWNWMKERFHVVYLDELIEIFSGKIEDYNSKLVA